MVSITPVGAAPGTKFARPRQALMRDDSPDPEFPKKAKFVGAVLNSNF